jgi:hypothetical protein
MLIAWYIESFFVTIGNIISLFARFLASKTLPERFHLGIDMGYIYFADNHFQSLPLAALRMPESLLLHLVKIFCASHCSRQCFLGNCFLPISS